MTGGAGAVSEPAAGARRSPAQRREYERARVAEHYEHHPEIFELVLDERLGYATGMFEDAHEDLDTAQERKYAWIAEQLAIDRCHIEDLALEPGSLDAILFVGSVVHMHHREDV